MPWVEFGNQRHTVSLVTLWINVNKNNSLTCADTRNFFKRRIIISERDFDMSHKGKAQATDIVTLPCGCIYQDKGWLLTRIKECDYHKRKRTAKRPYRSKAECVRP